MRQLAKDSFFRAYHAQKRLLGRSGRTLPILCYHRVSDDLRDHVTVGIEQFDQQIAFLKANYTIIGLRDLLDGSLNTQKTPVAITFDDGYLDNYENAFPILAKYGASATFFVSTDHITEQKPFAHDLDKLGRGLPNMSWDQIREMQRAGMDFGSHTANHVDLGQIDEATAWQELIRSDQTLRDQLGLKQNLFAFPFGRPQNLTEANHALIKKAGYHCCCSARGGLNNRENIDPFDIKRIGINYGSLPALAAYMSGWHRNHPNAT